MKLFQYLRAGISNSQYVYLFIEAQDPLATFVLPCYIVAALRAPFRCRFGTLSPWGFQPGFFTLGS